MADKDLMLEGRVALVTGGSQRPMSFRAKRSGTRRISQEPLFQAAGGTPMTQTATYTEQQFIEDNADLLRQLAEVRE
jgi:hypothetical protein